MRVLVEASGRVPVLAESDSLDMRITGAEALRCAAAQKKFFTGVDQNRIDQDEVTCSVDVAAPYASSDKCRWEIKLGPLLDDSPM